MKYFEHNHSNKLSYTFPPLKVSFSDLFSVFLKHPLVEYATADYRNLTFFKGGQSGTRHDKVLFSDLDIPVTHISYRQRYDRTGSHVKVGGLAIEYGRHYTPFFDLSNCGEGENFFNRYLFLLNFLQLQFYTF